jgi:hypothetical protein
MFDMQELTTLRLRRQALLLESDLNRLTFAAEFQSLRQAVNWVGGLSAAGRRFAPMALMMAPLAGVAMALGLRRSSARAGFLTRVLGVAPLLIRLWRACVPPSNVMK